MSMARGSRMLRYINYKMRITLQDSRVLVGVFMAFDRHMNIVLGDTQEFRKIRTKKTSGLSEEREEKRALGLIILRGDSVVSMTIEGPPPPDMDEKATPGGPGAVKMGAARGLPVPPMPAGVAPMGLAGPVRGIGGPGMGIMQPPLQVAAQAQGFPRGMPPPPPSGLPRPPMPPPGMMPGMPPGMPGMPGLPPGMPPGMMPPRAPMGMPPGMVLPPRGPQ
eukprot:gene2504-2742_t